MKILIAWRLIPNALFLLASTGLLPLGILRGDDGMSEKPERSPFGTIDVPAGCELAGSGKGSGVELENCDSPCRWWVRGAYLHLNRNGLPDRPLVGSGNGFQNSLFDAAQFDFDKSDGYEVELGYQLDECTSSFVKYSQIGTFDDSAFLPGRLGGMGVFLVNQTAAGFFGGVVSGRIQYESAADSFEWMIRRQCNPASGLMVGLRYFRLDETLGFQFNSSLGGSAAVKSSVSNDLIGAQVGVDHALWSRGGFKLSLLGKAGVFVNGANGKLHRRFTVPAVFNVINDTSRSTEEIAFVGEGEVKASYEFGCHRNWSLEAGYRVLWVDGISLASEQQGQNLIAAQEPMRFLDADDSLFFHGAFTALGLKF